MRYKVETTPKDIEEETSKGCKHNKIFKSITKTRQ
jgi:hypothetical protein